MYEFLNLSQTARVERGQPLAIAGRTGSLLRDSSTHLHTDIWYKKNGYYTTSIFEGEEWIWFKDTKIKNPHNLWAPHELDVPGQVKYIPFVDPKQPGKNYDPGFTYMVKNRTDEIISAPPARAFPSIKEHQPDK